MIAGIGAIVGGLVGLVRAQMGYAGLRVVAEMRDPTVEVDWNGMELENRLELATGAVFLVLLGLGGALLLARRAAGLTMVIIGGGLGIFGCLVPLATATHVQTQVMYVGLALACAVVLVMALLPATHRWVESRPSGPSAPANTPRSAVPPYN
ncbi:hypothetical protein ACFVAV_16920 [Nocardia sp. NPDC057663]|uniref:hypothetical protein n=1 Tax=Nocardia sp. NPDC057663 TaxID=3346201 RepID=UPI0036734835